MSDDRGKLGSPPPGMLAASVVLFAVVVYGAIAGVIAIGHSGADTFTIVLDAVLFVAGAFLGVVFLIAWRRGHKQ